jgi:hypothetical protein
MLCLCYYAYFFSSTKLKIILPGSKGVQRQWGEMTQTMHAHVNKGIKKKKTV